MVSWFSSRGSTTQPALGTPSLPLGSTTHVTRQITTQPTLRPAVPSALSLSSQTTVLNLAQPTISSAAFVVGEVVEYYSSSQGRWIPAKILAFNTNGTYNLDCKPDVAADKIRKPQGSGARYAVGDMVEYFSASQGKWIGAKVLEAKADGTYDLDCKPGVSSDKLRGALRVGDLVEYSSATQGKWIPAKVLAVNGTGTYNLDCKPEVPLDKIRRPEQQPPEARTAGVAYAPGDAVEYLSGTHGKWIPAKVVAANASGTYDLDCKPDVPADKIRGLQEGLASTLPAPVQAGSQEYKVGDVVEYFSATQTKWIPAKVLAANADGTYNLDCKPDVPQDKIRRPATQQRELEYKVRDVVEYFSATQNKWIPAKVVAVNSEGTYDLDCKPQVLPEKVRRPAAAENEVADGTGGGGGGAVHSVGDIVEYFGATLGKWIPARVLAVGPSGSYDLDCKPGAPAEKVRRPSGLMESTEPGSGVESAVDTPHRGGGRLVPAHGLSQPVQLLRAKRASGGTWRYEVCPEGAAALERFGSRRVAVASICGPRRTGKTMLLNALQDAGREASTSSRGGTSGLWLSAATQDDDEQGTLLAFIDCEGFGNGGEDRARDAQLLALCSLLSSAVLLNSPGGELSDSALAAMAPACRFGEAVEERGNEANRPTLVWILRDVTRQLQDAQGRTLSANDYLERALHAVAQGHEQGQAARETRRSLLHFFKHRTCSTLAAPGNDREFKDGVGKLRDHVVSACLANPKAVGGQLLSCFSLIQLLRQLVAAANDGRIMNIKAAWETVQHTTCGALADELREAASGMLRDLAAGRPVRGGAQLPLTDEALNAVLRDQRHTLKAHWEERAVGEESVRREYWQELKETLAREEALVRAQNAKLADQQGVEALKAWQEWLDDEDEGAAAAAEEICRQLGGTMERMPARPLTRIGRAAVQAAARRVAAARSAVRLTVERHGDLQRKAVAFGEKAAHQESAARSELDKKKGELTEARKQANEKEEEHNRFRDELEAKSTELQAAEEQLRAALADLEAAKGREREMATEQRQQASALESLQTELEQVRAAAAKDDAQRLAAERRAEAATEAAAGEQRRLEEELKKVKADAARCADELASEQASHEDRLAKMRAEHQQKVEGAQRQLLEEKASLQGQHSQLRTEHQRKVEDARQQVEEQRKAHAAALDGHRNRLLERERHNGVLEGKLHSLGSEADTLRNRVKELEEQVRQAEVLAEQRLRENNQLQTDLGDAKAAADRARSEAEERLRRLAEEEQARAEEMEDRKVQAKGCGVSVRRLFPRRRLAA